MASLPALPRSVLSASLPMMRVAAAAADRVLDHGGQVDADIAGQAADIREAARTQVDDLVLAVAGGIERVDAAGVIDGQRRRRGEARKVVDRARGRAEAVDRVAVARAGGAVHLLHRHDVGHHRGHDEAVGGAAVIALRHVGHHRHLPGVVGVAVVDAVAGRAVVAAGMAEPDGVADLVDEGLQRVAVDRVAAAVPGGRDVDARTR
jgi:hypothetical protein